MLVSHGLKVQAEAQVFDRYGKFKYSVLSGNDNNPAPNEIEVTIRNSDNSINKIEKYPFRSFVSNWTLVDAEAYGNTTQSKTRTTGNIFSANDWYGYIVNASYTTSNAGIIVGGSSTPASNTDYNLYNKYNNGVGTNNFDYSSCIVESPNYVDPYYNLVVRRVLTNYSGAALTIREIGLTGAHYNNFDAGYILLMARDVVDYYGNTINLSVLHNQSLEIKYIFRFSSTSGYLQNYFSRLYSWFRNASSLLTKTNGSSLSTTATWDILNASASYGNSNYGIVVGKSTDVPVYTNFQLGDSIVHGDTTGKLLYGGMEYSSPVIETSSSYHQIRRAFVNDTEDDITINEAGVVGSHSSNYVMFNHVPFDAIVLQPTESIRIIFTYSVDN